MKKANQVRLAKRYGIGSSTISYWADKPNFPAPIAGTGHHLWWNVSDVDAWVAVNRPKHLRKTQTAKAPVPVKVEPLTTGKTTLDVILFLLENDKAKQKLVLDLLLD